MSLTIGMALCLLLAFASLTARTAPPPTIAEFAPQAVEQIKEAPANQGAGPGEGTEGGPGGDGAGGALEPEVTTTTTSIVPPPPSEEKFLDVPNVRRCVGDPPRQIEDPQSPPCVAYWKPVDNGGATWKGVTADEVRIAMARPDGELSPTDLALQEFFNKRFEFYGRRIRLVPFASAGDRTVSDMKNDAAMVDTQIAPFASIAYSISVAGRSGHFYDELARREIIGIGGDYSGPAIADEAHYERFAPYQWSYLASPDKVLANYGEFACNALAGRPPKHTSPPISQAPSRKFGILNPRFSDGTPQVDVSPMVTKLSACGAEFYVRDFAIAYEDFAPAVLDLQNNGVTSALCLCPIGILSFGIQPAASGQGYFPEWLISNFGGQDNDFAGRTMPSNHAAHAIGLMSWNKQLPPQDWPIRWAVKEVDPELEPDMSGDGLFEYWGLLLASSGIQMAGPNLTPETFQQGLYRAQFPNPGAGAAPYYQATVDFAPFNHTMIQDFAPVWWSPTEQSVWETRAAGAYCYIRHGARHSLGNWPKAEQPFQQLPCR